MPRVPANLVMTAVSVLVPTCFVLVTFCTSLPSMAFIFSLMGLAEGCLEFFCNTQMIFLYRGSSGPFLQAMFFSQSVGALVSPLIIGSFMSKPLFRQWSNCSLPEELESAISAESLSDIVQRDPALGEMLSRVRYPFYVIAVLQIPIMLSMFYLSYKEGWTQEVSRGTEQEDELEDRREEGPSAYLVLAFASACAFTLDGLLGAFSGLIYTFSTHSVQSVDSEARAAYLPATFWGFTLIGRLLGIFITARLSSVHIIFLDLVGLVFSATLFMIGQKSMAVLFLSTMLTGFFISHCMPALLALTEQFIQVTRDRATSLVASAAFGEAVLPVLMAAVMNKIHPIAYPIFYSVFVVIAVILCFFFVSLGYQTKKSQFNESRFDSFLRSGFFARLMPKKEETMPMQSRQQQQQPQEQFWQGDAGFELAAHDGTFEQQQQQQSSFTVHSQQRNRRAFGDDSFDELANRHI
ncbi:hypothetical protein BOX15_Mlig034514g1 [Macrostomum lignano]|uniref:MFS domain-containing protein n=2 Tax=Macrostomum lignano TaxID=282301 RepID=A0A267G046_9PLAT|nr:hypothetical protein BOX15_Mlig034514g2 [Macrostomum lignano]PAA79346.1 hypothetical protein BOX15_Mlig034514g1 [Macrostomum lignano]